MKLMAGGGEREWEKSICLDMKHSKICFLDGSVWKVSVIQETWEMSGSGRSPVCESENVSCSVVSDSLWPPWTVAPQALLSMNFSRQKYWRRLPFPSPGDLPDPGTKPKSPALQTDSLPSQPPESSKSLSFM